MIVMVPGGPTLFFLPRLDMKNRMKAAACVASALTVLITQHASAETAMWAANPVGTQSVPNAPSITLLPSNGYVPLRTASGKCLLVARRGTQIVAVELTPMTDGAKVIGWKPQTVDMDTVTSKWGYHADASGSIVTRQMADQKSSTWTNTHVQALASGESESSVSVTANGKTYRKYSHFKPATPDAPQAASDEYICQ